MLGCIVVSFLSRSSRNLAVWATLSVKRFWMQDFVSEKSSMPYVKERRTSCKGQYWALHMSSSSRERQRDRVRLSNAAIRDLKWWASISSNEHIRRTVWGKADSQLFTDANMSGWGAAWNGIVQASGFFDVRHEGAHINELKLLAALYSLKAFVDSHETERSNLSPNQG